MSVSLVFQRPVQQVFHGQAARNRNNGPSLSIVEQPQIPVRAFLGLCPFPAAARGERAAGADAGEDQFLLVQRQVEQAEDDASKLRRIPPC